MRIQQKLLLLAVLLFSGSVLAQDYYIDVTNNTGYNSPIFDVRLVDEDGDTYTFWEVDVSRYDLVVTLNDLD